MVDRDARNRLANLIRRYLGEEITAFEIDDALDEFRSSDDDTVRFVSDDVWHYYDDCDDHLVVLTKPTWNYFQRLLLLLESDSEVRVTRSTNWSYTQAVAAVLLLLCIGIADWTGVGYHLLVFFMPFGACSIAISLLRLSRKNSGPFDAVTRPFATIADLGIAYDHSSFQKTPYPAGLENRSIRSPLMNWFWWAYHYLGWTMVAPLPLLFQCLPVTTSDVKVNPA